MGVLQRLRASLIECCYPLVLIMVLLIVDRDTFFFFNK